MMRRENRVADADIGGLEMLIAVLGYVAIIGGIGTFIGIVAGLLVGRIMDKAKTRRGKKNDG